MKLYFTELTDATIVATALGLVGAAFTLYAIPTPKTWFLRLPFLTISLIAVVGSGFFIAIFIARLGLTKTGIASAFPVPLLLFMVYALIRDLSTLWKEMRSGQQKHEAANQQLKEAEAA